MNNDSMNMYSYIRTFIHGYIYVDAYIYIYTYILYNAAPWYSVGLKPELYNLTLISRRILILWNHGTYIYEATYKHVYTYIET